MTQETSFIKFENVFAMPNKRTFQIKPIKKLIDEEKPYRCEWLDPFPYPYIDDALEHLKPIESDSIDVVLFDPPYSPRQLKECYDEIGQSWDGTNSLWSQWSGEIARVIKPGGKCIKFGWNTGLIRKDFRITRYLLVNHGSHHNDTIVTVQVKDHYQKTLDRNCSP